MKDINNWYRLDNAAKIFPAASSSDNTSTFRVAITLKEKIKPEFLQRALDIVILRFPTLGVRIRKGLFWYFFEPNEKKLLIQREIDYPCHKIDLRTNNGYLLKVLYFNCRISVEIFHSLTDGNGALEFLKSLTYEYLRMQDIDIQHENMILTSDDIPSKYEIEDSFQKYYQPCDLSSIKEKKAYQIEGTFFDPFGNNVIHGVVSTSEINTKAKEYGVTITEYIIGLFIYSIYNETMRYGIYNEPVKIAVPVNLRKIFPSKTLRNFFSVVNVGLSLGNDVALEDILKEVTRQLRDKIKRENLYPKIAENIRFEKLLIARFIPLWIKNIIMRLAFYNSNIRKTSTVTNMGRIKLPESMSKQVERIDAILYSSKKSPINCGVCSVNDKLTITFSRSIVKTEIIRHFFSYISKQEGISVDIYSNEWGIKTNEKM